MTTALNMSKKAPPKMKFPDFFPYVRLSGPLGPSVPLRTSSTHMSLAVTAAMKRHVQKRNCIELRVLINVDTSQIPQHERHKDFDPGSISIKDSVFTAKVSCPMWKKIDGYYVNSNPLDVSAIIDTKEVSTIQLEILIDSLAAENVCGVAEFYVSRKTTVPTLRKSVLHADPIPDESIVKMSEDMKDSGVEFQVVSLKCPCLGTRINLPCRFDDCKHAECFDLDNFLKMEEKRPKGRCPICNSLVELRKLGICNFTRMLLLENDKCTSYRILPTGIEPLSHEEKENATLSARRKRQRNGEYITEKQMTSPQIESAPKKKPAPPTKRPEPEDIIVLD